MRTITAETLRCNRGPRFTGDLIASSFRGLNSVSRESGW